MVVNLLTKREDKITVNSNKVKEINALISDIDCLEPLYKWTNEVNIFNILKLDRMEIRHSNMLSWLLTPGETHGLGDKFLRKLLIYATSEGYFC